MKIWNLLLPSIHIHQAQWQLDATGLLFWEDKTKEKILKMEFFAEAKITFLAPINEPSRQISLQRE